MEGEEQSWRTDTPSFETSHKVVVMETVQYWQKKRRVDQWNSAESPTLTHVNVVEVSLTKEHRQYSGAAGSACGARAAGRLHVENGI